MMQSTLAARGDGELVDATRACSERGWRWVAEHLERFTPADPLKPESMKEIGELALIYALTRRWRGAEPHPDMETIGDFLVDFCSHPVTIDLARKRPSYFTAYAFSYLALRSIGVRLDGFEEALSSLRRVGYPDACERQPFRRMEIEYALWKAGLSRHGPRLENHPGTTFELCGNPAYLVTWEIYSITHTLFYLTDFAGPVVEMSAEKRAKAILLVEALLSHSWRSKNWDLSGELLLNLLALGRRDALLYRLCMKALLDAWREDGPLPGPYLGEAQDSEPETLFKHCYHTTLVGLLLCGGHLYRARAGDGERGD